MKNNPRIGRVNPLSYWLGRLWMAVSGWRAQGPPPDYPKYVAAFAPHSSNWDAPIGIAMSFILRIRGNFLVKDSVFSWPVVGRLLGMLGGIGVDRRNRHNYVDQAAQAFHDNDRLILALAPEATRTRTDFWKSGFYYIALKAQVPIVFAYFDYKRKTCGHTGVTFFPTGDIEADLERIRAIYANITACHPEWVGPVRFKERAPACPRKPPCDPPSTPGTKQSFEDKCVPK